MARLYHLYSSLIKWTCSLTIWWSFRETTHPEHWPCGNSKVWHPLWLQRPASSQNKVAECHSSTRLRQARKFRVASVSQHPCSPYPALHEFEEFLQLFWILIISCSMFILFLWGSLMFLEHHEISSYKPSNTCRWLHEKWRADDIGDVSLLSFLI